MFSASMSSFSSATKHDAHSRSLVIICSDHAPGAARAVVRGSFKCSLPHVFVVPRQAWRFVGIVLQEDLPSSPAFNLCRWSIRCHTPPERLSFTLSKSSFCFSFILLIRRATTVVLSSSMRETLQPSRHVRPGYMYTRSTSISSR